MNERQEATADVLGKLTVLGTIVLPMNIITGLWGMNCLVPGQDSASLNWFYGSMLSSYHLLAGGFPSPLHFVSMQHVSCLWSCNQHFDDLHRPPLISLGDGCIS